MHKTDRSFKIYKWYFLCSYPISTRWIYQQPGRLRKYNTFPGNNVTCDSWKEVANSLLPAVNSNFIFAAYVDQTFPVSDTFFADKTFFENYSSYQKPVFLFFLLCSFLFLAAFVWLTAIAGRKTVTKSCTFAFLTAGQPSFLQD